jgi:putative phosphoserine phosphatase/1-acylglycerol-3-phosphate O-acyltransferase
LLFARFDIQGVTAIPETGPAILVSNHRSYFDPVVLEMTAAKVGRAARFLAKKEMFEAPVVGQLMSAVGAIRVDRGSGSNAPLEAAGRALRAGELIALLPQGTIPRGPEFFDPELKGRPGAARLARSTGAPVIPVAVWGTERVWPRSSKLPRLITVNPPRVRVRVGSPVMGLTGDEAADTKRIMAAIRALLPPEAHVRRDPTQGELRATYPSGKIPEDALPA